MGALAPVAPWIAEDDLLLKNAVEAGASLESLAKGAVRFSRRYTTRELQDRWYALLYDPDTSEQASIHMFETELSTSNLSSQSNRLGDSEGNRGPRKRKEESVRSQYYAMRKRICNEPFNNNDLSFLVAPTNHNCTGNRDGYQEPLTIHNEHPIGMLGDPIRNHFSLQDTGFGMMHHGFPQDVAPENLVGVGNATHTFHTGDTNSLEGDIPSGIMGSDCFYGFVENVPPVSVNEAGENDIGHSFEHDNEHKDIPHILGENLNVLGNNSVVQEMGPPQAMPVNNLFEANDLKTKGLSDFDPTNNHPGTVCSEFGESRGFNSPVSDCRASFHQLGYSSPVPTVPIWRTSEDMSIDENLGDKNEGPGGALALHDDDAKRTNACEYQVFPNEFIQQQPQMEGRACDVELSSSNTIPEGDFVELSNSILNFGNEEVLLYMDVDGKEVMGKSPVDGMNSILERSNDVHRDAITSITEPQASAVLVTYTGVACSGEFEGLDEKLHSEVIVASPEIKLQPSKSVPNPHSPERRNGIICCTLNTEDPEIPSNDDVLLPIRPFSLTASSVMRQNTEEAGNSATLSNKNFSDHQEGSEQGPALVKENQDPFVVSQKRETQVLPELCSNNLTNGCGVKPELHESNSVVLNASNAGTVGGDLNKCRSASLTPYSIPTGRVREGTTKVELWKQHDFDNSDNFLTKRPLHGCDHIKDHLPKIIDCCEQEENFPVAYPNLVSRHAEHGSFEMDFPELAANAVTSDLEEQRSDDDDDVPYFSDIEAMILDMDLGPQKQESCFSREVSRYQYEHTKKAIIRLEQGANSYMQRAVASHGALAILYNRHIKHYITKQEVLLGRASEDGTVDIDLAREGRGHKISRKQARIKMEDNGTFCLTNLGRCPILVNSKEVVKGHCARLSSSCLIEIRSMSFLFETNETAIKRHIAAHNPNNQDKSLKSEWSPEGIV